MTDRLDVKAGERGLVRLFALDLPPEALDGFAEGDPSPLQEALGAQTLDMAFVEVFPVRNLTGLGLPGYMVDGLGVAEAEVEADRARLEAIEGQVVVVLSRAFGDVAQSLKPRAPLRWIGTYREETATVSFETLPSEAAKGTVGPAGKPAPSDAAVGGRIALVVLVLLFALVGLMIWIAA